MKKLLLAFTALLLFHMPAGAEAKKKSSHRKAAKAKPTYYYNNSDGTMSQGKPDAQRPSAYKGDHVPENDGPKKNGQRNLNYNSGQPLPSNSGR